MSKKQWVASSKPSPSAKAVWRQRWRGRHSSADLGSVGTLGRGRWGPLSPHHWQLQGKQCGAVWHMTGNEQISCWPKCSYTLLLEAALFHLSSLKNTQRLLLVIMGLLLVIMGLRVPLDAMAVCFHPLLLPSLLHLTPQRLFQALTDCQGHGELGRGAESTVAAGTEQG